MASPQTPLQAVAVVSCGFMGGTVGAPCIQMGLASFTHPGAGVYLLNLSAALGQGQGFGWAGVMTGAATRRSAQIEQVSATQWRVRTFIDGGAGADVPTDLDFSFAILRMPVHAGAQVMP